MEHEDNAHLDNFLQNSQNLMDNLQIASGGGVCGEVGGMMVVGEEIGVGSISGKFEEHEEHDDHGEWKYIKEVQQSEKQQQQTTMKVDDAGKNVYGNDGNEEGVGNSNSNGNGDAGEHEESTAAANVDVDAMDEEEVEIIKNDGDFSTTSNTTSTVGEDEDIVGSGAGGVDDMLQVEMKIETQNEHHQDALHPFGGEELEEEDPSSLATNTTNGTSSLSENPPPQDQQQHEHEQGQNQEEINFDVHEDKENADPLTATSDNNSRTHPTDFDFELHSQLNPDAKEFVPSFGSSPTSPTNANAVVTFESLAANVGEPANIEADVEAAAISSFFEQQQPHPAPAAAGIVARHLIGADGVDDDFVAQSPRKGRGSNMDAISLPAENEFEHEVAKRPHELEQEDDIIAVSLQQQQEQQHHSHEQFENGNVDVDNLLKNNDTTTTNNTEDCLDFQGQASTAAGFVDHGPETSVDLDLDIDLQSDFMKQSLYLANESAEEPIENILNTVQQLPSDFGDEIIAGAGQKELLNFEEKENVSHSPSTEEMQMNLQNDFNLSASARDIPQIPIDMDNAAHMQGSFYMENTSADTLKQEHELEPGFEPSAITSTDESLLIDTTLPIGGNISDISFETVRTSGNYELQTDELTVSADIATEVTADAADDAASFTNNDAISSSLSTEEKHLIEDTKEKQLLADSAALADGLHEVQQQMNDLLLTNDGNLSQIEEVAQTATTIVDNLNPFLLQENVKAFDAESEIIDQHAEEAQQPLEEPEQLVEEPEQHVEKLQTHVEELQPHVEELQPHVEEPQQYVEEPQQHVEEPQQHVKEPQLHVEALQQHVEEPQQHVEEPQYEHEHQLQPDVLQFEQNYENEQQQQHFNVLLLQDEKISHPIEEAPQQVKTPEVESIAPTPEEAFIEKAIAAAEETTEAAPIAIEAALIVEAAAAGAAIIGAVAATAAVAKSTTTATKKTEPAKKPNAKIGTASAKPKVSDATKKAAGGTTSRTAMAATTTARPRTAPTKPTTHTTEKKTTTAATTAAASKPAATTRKPLTSSTSHTTTASRSTLSKPTAGRPTTAPTSTASKTSTAARSTAPTAARTSTLATARKATATTTTNGTAPAAKPRLSTGISAAPTKPTTLGLSATAKPKLSPRATLTSQLRKVSGPLTAVKSPNKATAPTTNGVTKSSTTASASAGGRTMKTNTTTSTTTKTFTARPAPKTTITTTTGRRTTLGTSPAAGTTGSNTNNTKLTTTTTKNTLSARSPMSRPASGRLSLSPTKASTLKSKSTSTTTKDVTKKATPSKTTTYAGLKGGKQPTPTQQKDSTAVPKTNGTVAAVIMEGEELQNKEQVVTPHLNGGGDDVGLGGAGDGQHLLLEFENGNHNGGGDARDEEFNLLLEQQKAEGALIDD